MFDLSIKTAQEGEFTKITYERTAGGSAEIKVSEAIIWAGDNHYYPWAIMTIYKKNSYLEEQSRYAPSRPTRGGLFASLGAAMGQAVKEKRMEEAQRQGWSVWINIKGAGGLFSPAHTAHRLADGLSEPTADALAKTLFDLVKPRA